MKNVVLIGVGVLLLTGCTPMTSQERDGLARGLRGFSALQKAPVVRGVCADTNGFARSGLVPGLNSCLVQISIPDQLDGLEVRVRTKLYFIDKYGDKFLESVNAVQLAENPTISPGNINIPFGYEIKRKSLSSLSLKQAYAEITQPDFRALARVAGNIGVYFGLSQWQGATAFYAGGVVGSLAGQAANVYRADLNPYAVSFEAITCIRGTSTCSPLGMTMLRVAER